MKFYAYVHDKEELTKPVFVMEINKKNEGEALEIAMKNPGVKAICGKQQTGRLVVKLHVHKLNLENLK